MTNTINSPGVERNPVDEFTMPKDPKTVVDEKPVETKAKESIDSEHLLKENAESTQDLATEEALQPSVEDMLKAELADTKDRMLRLAADFENYKKISQREQMNSVKFAQEALIINLLPIIDNLEQAVLACKKSAEGVNNDVLVGVEMVVKQLADVLRKSGVEVFSAVGLPFDPARHEAMGEQISDTVDEGCVVVEYQKGYLLHGRLLRPARVVVAKRSGN